MEKHLKEHYKAVFRQGFIPIMVADRYPASLEIAACLKAGCRVIEITQRRPDAAEIIPALKQEHPELILLAGSTLDAAPLIRNSRHSHPELHTLDEFAELGVDGFVSMAGFQAQTLERFRNEKLLLPCAYTPNEAISMFCGGAHFIKVIGPDLRLLHLLNASPLFHTVPCFITGGMTLERIPEAVRSGAVLTGTGFDLMLTDYAGEDPDEIAAIIRRYMQTFHEARNTFNPGFAALGANDDDALWHHVLNYYDPLDDGEK